MIAETCNCRYNSLKVTCISFSKILCLYLRNRLRVYSALGILRALRSSGSMSTKPGRRILSRFIESVFVLFISQNHHRSHRHVRYALFFHCLAMVACVRQGDLVPEVRDKYLTQIGLNQDFIKKCVGILLSYVLLTVTHVSSDGNHPALSIRALGWRL